MSLPKQAPVRCIDSSGMIVIPKAIREKLDIKPGDPLKIHITEAGNILIEKVNIKDFFES